MTMLGSIHRRLSFALLLILPLICGLLAWSLEQAFSTNLINSEKNQLTLHAYALIAEAELENGQLQLPEQFQESRLNQTSSGLFAVVYRPDTTTPDWQTISASGENIPLADYLAPFESGTRHFAVFENGSNAYFTLQYDLIWEDENRDSHPYQLLIVGSQEQFRALLADYRKSLWAWLVIIALSLIALQLLALKWGLSPLSTVVDDLDDIKQGDRQRLSGKYPKELDALTKGLNTLLEHQSSQRERYRNTLADLAHSIKTPLAIIQGNIKSGELNLRELEEQSERINQIVRYQLNKARGSSQTPFIRPLPLLPVCTKIIGALQRLYSEKSLQVKQDIPNGLSISADSEDVMELLGTLLENAFKYGTKQIRLSASQTPSTLCICIEDDGPGIAPIDRQRLVQRGARADTALPGQGIGLAVAYEIINNYQGNMQLEQSSLGGLLVKLVFKQH